MICLLVKPKITTTTACWLTNYPDMFWYYYCFQDSMKFVQQVVLEDFSKVKGIPSDCSEVMVWHVVDTTVPSSSSLQPSTGNKRG
jgi:hypothetical protein